MTSAEKILASIIDKAKENADKILVEAQEKAAKLKKEATDNALVQSKAIIDAANKKAELIISTGKSGAELIVRDASLACRREQIDAIIEKTVEAINNMADKEYFDFLMSIIDKNGLKHGTMLLSAKDLKRNLSDFKAKLGNIVISDTAADINGGFILKQGDIEINASLDALVHEKRSMLVDEINNIIGKG